MHEPETRPSLMMRLHNADDHQAWARFVSVYEPLVFRLVRRRGLQEADAQDVTQQVIIAVMNAVDSWQPDGKERSFRRWLYGIARKLTVRFLQRELPLRGRPQCGLAGSELISLLNSLPEPDDGTVEQFDEEYRDALFRLSADRVRHEFRDAVWNAFWRTFVMNEPVAEVADDLGMTVGYVYVSRSRVIARLRQVVQEIESETQGE